MPFLAVERLRTPAARTSLYYFVLLMVMAVANPYLGIWLAGKGLTPEQIGIVNAAPYFVVIVLNQIVGRLADRAKDWKTTIVIGSCAGAVGPLCLFFVNDFPGILVAWSMVILPFLAIGPVVDAASIRLARRVGADFSIIRMWGSLGFVVTTLLAGVALEWWGVDAFLPAIAAAAILRALVSLQLPLFRGPNADPAEQPVGDGPRVAHRARDVWKPWLLLPVLGVALIHASHAMQAAFGAIVWQQAGIDPVWFGALWAVATAGEIAVMLVFARIAKRFSARHLILFAAAMTVIRWACFALNPPLWAMFLLQLMNLATFGLSYLGVINFIANWTGERIAAEAVAIFQMLRQVATVTSLIAFGYLTAQFGVGAYLGAAALGAIAAVLTFVSLSIMPAVRERARPS